MSQPGPSPKIDGDRQRHRRPRGSRYAKGSARGLLLHHHRGHSLAIDAVPWSGVAGADRAERAGHDPYSGALFLFRSKRGDGVKCLVWDQTGLVLVYKKLEG